MEMKRVKPDSENTFKFRSGSPPKLPPLVLFEDYPGNKKSKSQKKKPVSNCKDLTPTVRQESNVGSGNHSSDVGFESVQL